MKKIFILFCLAIILILCFSAIYLNTYALSKFGSSGEEVKQIQTKLKAWGYYTGSVDGIYGSQTVAAVKKFQQKNGLTVDGIAGSKTLAALGINTGSSSSGSGSSLSMYFSLSFMSFSLNLG